MATTWTDDPTGKTVPFKAQHVNELRAAIQAVPGVTVLPWGRGNRVNASTNIRAQDLLDLRRAIGPGGAGTVWGQRSIAAGSMLWTQTLPATSGLGQVLRATHVDDLRRWFNTSETGAASYQFPQVRPLIFGINPSWKSTPGHYPDPFDDQMLGKIHAAGGTCIRSGINWADVEPTQGTRNFGLFDYQIGLVQKYGLTWIADVGTAPNWATGNSSGQMPPTDAHTSDFVAFVTATAQRYLGQIHHYECVNEPNGAGWVYPSGTMPEAKGQLYAPWLQRFYQAIKAVDPAAWVSSGGVDSLHSDSGLPFIQGIYDYAHRMGGTAFFDAVAGHPYNLMSAPMDTAGIQSLQQLMANLANGDQFKPIWITEYGWSLTDISPAQQQTNLQNALTFFANPNDNYVTIATFQLIADVPTAMMGLTDQFLSPRPAYGTFSSFSKPTT